MVSRQTTRPLRKLVPAVAIGIGALIGIVGCSAGQVAQTAEMPPAVNGNSGDAGPLALRDVQVAFPEHGEAYKAGEDAPLTLTIINTAGQDDELVSVTSPAGEVEMTGNPKLPGRTKLQVVVPDENPAASTAESSEAPESSETVETSESGSAAPTGEQASSSAAPTSVTVTETPEEEATPVVGTISLVITGLKADLPFGKNVPVTFEFANGGKVTIQLPVAAPSTPRAAPTEAGEGEH